MHLFRKIAIIMALATIIWTAVILLSNGVEDGTVFTLFIGASAGFSVVAIVAAAKRLRYEMAAINVTSTMATKGIHEMKAESAAVEVALNVVSILVVLMWFNHWVG